MTDRLGCLDELPRVRLATDPTPLERLTNLEREIAGPQLYVKRDDTHPLAFGGNKVRQLEFYFGEAREAGADTVLITGAVQSNFCRLCAAFAARLDMKCDIQLEERVAHNSPFYRTSGNLLVQRLLGATGGDAVMEGLIERHEAGLAIGLIPIRNRAKIVEQAGMGLFPGLSVRPGTL